MTKQEYTAIELHEGEGEGAATGDLGLSSQRTTFSRENIQQFSATARSRTQRAAKKSFKVSKRVSSRFNLRTHLLALILFVLGGVLPLAFFYQWVDDPWTPMHIHCEYVDVASSDPAIQGLVTIDGLVVTLPFWAAKLLDTTWDLFVGRGLQFLAAYLSYVVFTKAMLRAIEQTPTPYRTFSGLSINGVGIATLFSLLGDLRRHRTKRTTLLFTWVAVSSFYVLSISTLFSAMTGYVSALSAYIPTSDAGQLMPYDKLDTGYLIRDGERVGVQNGSCSEATDELSLMLNNARFQRSQCGLQWVCNPIQSENLTQPTSNCSYVFSPYTVGTSRNGTFIKYLAGGGMERVPCSTHLSVELNGKSWDLGYNALNIEQAKCFNGKAYALAEIDVVCLPRNTDGKYQWGFSRMLTAVVLILHFIWSSSLYLIWIDAVICSKLVKSGFSMTQLRGAFAVVSVAQEAFDVDAEKLIMKPVDEVEKKLFQRDSMVDYALLVKGREEPEPPFANVEPHPEV